MQPEVNNQEKPRLETVVNEVTAMETKPVATEAPKENVAFTNKPKKNHGMLYGMILLAILAIGGIGFGVWAMMDGSSQKNNYEEQISTLKNQINELQEQIGDNSSIIDIDTDTTDANTADYIYVGEWGLKIAIPDSLKKVSYRLDYEDEYQSLLSVSGVIGEVNGLPDFANLNKNISSLGLILRVSKEMYNGEEYSDGDIRVCGIEGGLVFSDDNYNYCYSHPQSVYSTDSQEQEIEKNSANLIKQMLDDKSSYSKI